MKIDELIEKGLIKIIDDEGYYIDLLEKKFPFVGSKIDWNRVPNSTSSKCQGDFIEEGYLFFEDCLEKGYILLRENIVIVGDSFMENALETKVENLTNILRLLLKLPQHTYIFDKECRWCLSFTMEGYFDFGKLN